MVRVKQLLQNWGIWARCRLGTEYPPVALGMVDSVRWSQNTLELTFTDEIALRVDKAVAELKLLEGEGRDLHYLLKHYYVSCYSCRYLAEVYDCRPDRISRELARGEMWVAARLYNETLVRVA